MLKPTEKLQGKKQLAFKSKVALAASSKLDHQMRTIKFPVDVDVSSISDELTKVYYTVSGTEEGSLYRFMLSLSVLGFVFRSSSSKVDVLFSETKLNAPAVNEKLADSGFPSTFSAKSIFQALTTNKRAKATIDCNSDEIHKHFFVRWGGKAKDMESALYQFVRVFASTVADHVSSWDDFNAIIASGDIRKLFDISFSNHVGYALPVKFADIVIEEFPVKFSSIFAKQIGINSLSELAHVKTNKDDFLIHLASVMAMIDGVSETGVVDAPKAAASLIKEHLTTSTANALSWLFNSGLAYFHKTDAKQVALDYQVPQEIADYVCTQAKQITLNHALGTGYSNMRATVQGQVDSWVSNYMNRLYAIDEMVSQSNVASIKLPEALAKVNASNFFAGLAFDYDMLVREIARLSKDEQSVGQYLSVLCGKSVYDGSFNLLDAIKRVNAYQQEVALLSSTINIIHARIKTQIEASEKSGNYAALEIAQACAFDWKDISFDRINQRSVEKVDHKTDIELRASSIFTLLEAANNHLEYVLNESINDDNYFDTFEREKAKIAKLKQQPNNPLEAAKQQAIRAVWSYVLKQVRNLSRDSKDEAIAHLKGVGLFVADKRDQQNRPHNTLNKFMFNQVGEVYQSLSAPVRHQQYQIDYSIDAKSSCLTLLTKLNAFVLSRAASTDKSQKAEVYLRDWIDIQKTVFGLKMMYLPKMVPTALLKCQVLTESDNFPPQYAIALNSSEYVDQQIAKRVLNHYFTLIGLHTSYVMRESFMIKMSFASGKDVGMVWQAKDEDWKPPFTASRNPYMASLMNEQSVIPSKVLHSVVSPNNDGKNPVKGNDPALKDRQTVLKNYPHQLFIELPFSAGNALAGDRPYYYADKESFTIKKIRGQSFGRVAAPSSYRGILLDAMLHSSDDIKLSQPSYIIEGMVKQSVAFEFDDQGLVCGIQVNLSEPKWTTFVSQPISEHPRHAAKGEALNFFDRCVAIDLGERGIGYAVYDVRTKEKIAEGYDRLPTLAKLPSLVKSGSKSRNPKQSYKQVFSTRMMQMRDNAIGELKHHINSLMAHYKAFPIFESRLSGFDREDKDIELALNGLLDYYLFNETSTVKSTREANWMSAGTWTHPYLQTPEMVEKAGKYAPKTDKAGNIVYKDLKLFPGVAENPYGTSQECSACGTNPIEAIRNHFKDAGKNATVAIDSNGTFTLNDGITYQVEKRYAVDDLPQATVKDLHRRNRRMPWGKKYAPGNYSESELMKMMRDHIRRPHDNLRAKGSKASQYHCANTGCACHNQATHADTNAANNLALKFLRKIVVKSVE